jgi:hypothetical protein
LRYFRWLIRLNGNKAIEAFKTDGFESLCFFPNILTWKILHE